MKVGILDRMQVLTLVIVGPAQPPSPFTAVRIARTPDNFKC